MLGYGAQSMNAAGAGARHSSYVLLAVAMLAIGLDVGVARITYGVALPAFARLRATEPPDDELVWLPLEEASRDMFAVRVSGTSMDGGKDPLRDGDWAVMRVARSMPASAVHASAAGKVATHQVVADRRAGVRRGLEFARGRHHRGQSAFR